MVCYTGRHIIGELPGGEGVNVGRRVLDELVGRFNRGEMGMIRGPVRGVFWVE